ncbi:MAG TPA: OmpA family protein [Noviherbaspirillum sp.]|nr:OmpA family protein [Noviherbaspirillum sp.]
MKTVLRKKRLVLLIGTIGLACGNAPAQDDVQQGKRGKMIDRSNAIDMHVPASSETESPQFAGLPPSGLTLGERKQMLEAAPPEGNARQVVKIEDELNAATFDSGRAVLLPPAHKILDELVDRVRGKTNIRFQIVGHTDNQRIAPSLRKIYPDNQALSEARALAVAAYLKTRLQLSADAFAVAGMGERVPVADNDTPEGMAKNRRTRIRIWFEDAASALPPAPSKSVERTVSRDACAPGDLANLPFSISIDGAPMGGDTVQREADRQRCVDVALEKSDIQVKYDPLNVAPALNVWAFPGTAVRSRPAAFGTYTNYAWWLRKAELRIFAKGQGTQETPLAVIPVDIGGTVEWQAPDNAPDELGFLLRVYDEKGRFDETAVKPLRLLDRAEVETLRDRAAREKLYGWGENALKVSNIPVAGGSVTISGEKIKPGRSVKAMGVGVPVDAKGRFVMRQILPSGPHAVEVAVRDEQGAEALFRRNLSIADRDWFYVAMADLTVGRDRTRGPAALVTADTSHYENETWVDGRGAFYLKGKIKGEYLLTASADTREQPLKDLFSNFQSKDPRYLLRRIDPDKYYPVYGDDATIVDDAPTQGKFYVRLEKGDSHVMWGNFQTAWTGTELTQYTRGLYGANALWHAADVTSYGEKSTSVNLFAAEPGTLQSREEFRGTGGSLYYLRRQDLTQGSERLWVEIRDRDSGMVIQRNLLAPAQDYEINYLQGRVTLRAPLPSTADGSTLVQTSSLSGNPVYLVATYEYVPSLTAVSGSAVGLRAGHWFNDNLRVGASVYHQGDSSSDQDLKGLDATFRYKPGTWVKMEVARSSGIGSSLLTSSTGGFEFNQPIASAQRADAQRVEAAVDLSEVSDGMKGRVTGYWQDRDAGFSGPGQVLPTGEAVRQTGLAAAVPVSESAEVAVKADERDATSQSMRAMEAAVRLKVAPEWGVSAGLRHDDRENAALAANPTASSILNQVGRRNDVIVRVDYRPLADEQDETTVSTSKPATTGAAPVLPAGSSNGPVSALVPKPAATPLGSGIRPTADPATVAGVAGARVPGMRYERWDMYGYVQHTLSRSGTRSDNDRVGVGAGWQVSDKLRAGAEVSAGSGGAGGKLSTDYRISDRSDVYLAYAVETENPNVNYTGRQGTLTTGTHYRLTDQVGLFGETRWSNGAGPQSLTNAFGVDLAPNAEWTTGIKMEFGTLSDPLAGDLRRKAIGLSASYSYEKTKFTTALEFRDDRSSSVGTVAGTCSSPSLAVPCVPAAGINSRKSWLTRNSLGYQVDPAWRLLGKLNLSRSVSSQGAFYDGDFTEVVMGAAYRPVDNDRWNALFKYTYFYNLPSSGQIDNGFGSPLDYTQKSHVLNADFIYDVRPWVSVGMKYGVRLGDLRPSKTAGDWFSSRADLVVLRADFHWVREWDAVLEWRRLNAREAGDARSGMLAGLYRHIGQHAKIGAGYNFTDFSDDLTDLSYRSRGWFINALGSF